MLDFQDFSQAEPANYEEIIVTDGKYFRSGMWIIIGGKGVFQADPNRNIECLYWIPKPELDACENLP